jgi:hypothetical protein
LRRVILAILVTAGLVLSTSPAQAEHGDFFDLFRDWSNVDALRWADSGTAQYCVSEEFYSHPGLTNQQSINAAETMENAFNRWENNTDLSKNFDQINDSNGCGNINYDYFWDLSGHDEDELCRIWPNAQSSIQYENLAAGVYGRTHDCDMYDAGFTDQFIIVINTDSVNQMQWKWDVDPTNTEVDFLGLMMHEGGHVLGYDDGYANNGHFNPNSSACGSPLNTMCPGSAGFFGSKDNRTVETHDKGEVNEFYP